MRIRIYIFLLALLIVTLTASALFGLSPWVIAGEAVPALIVIILIYNAAVGPLKAVQNGVYLLRAQDFSSRLKRTGQAEADKVASLFNGLMDTLRAERLKNLEQENFLGKVVEASPMGIAICDFDGNISETNPAWRELISPTPFGFSFKYRARSAIKSKYISDARVQLKSCMSFPILDSPRYSPFTYRICSPSSKDLPVARFNLSIG